MRKGRGTGRRGIGRETYGRVGCGVGRPAHGAVGGGCWQ